MSSEVPSTRVSLRDIAKKVGVSHVTVSLALRNHPRISTAVRERIRALAEEMGYRPDPMLAALANYRKEKSSAPIAAAIGWINGWEKPEDLRKRREFDSYWTGAHAAAEKAGYRLEEFLFGGKVSPQRLHQILTARGIRGLLLPPHRPQPDWGNFPWDEYSVVRISRSVVSPRFRLVTADHVANTALAFQEIRARGYRRVGFLTDESELIRHGQLFAGGYLSAQRLVDESERLPICDLGKHAPPQQPRAILAWFKAHKPDAIFTDLPEAPELLAAAGIRVPEDVGLAGTTVLDTPISAGINQHPEEIGRAGFQALNSILNEGTRGTPGIFRQILVEGSWVDGPSLPRR